MIACDRCEHWMHVHCLAKKTLYELSQTEIDVWSNKDFVCDPCLIQKANEKRRLSISAASAGVARPVAASSSSLPSSEVVYEKRRRASAVLMDPVGPPIPPQPSLKQQSQSQSQPQPHTQKAVSPIISAIPTIEIRSIIPTPSSTAPEKSPSKAPQPFMGVDKELTTRILT